MIRGIISKFLYPPTACSYKEDKKCFCGNYFEMLLFSLENNLLDKNLEAVVFHVFILDHQRLHATQLSIVTQMQKILVNCICIHDL